MTILRQKHIAKHAEAKLLKRIDLTSELMLIWLERPPEFTFKPGQYCTIGLDGIERAYSIASAPYEDYLELFIELVSTGELTPRLWNVKVNDSLSIRPRAKGIFTLEPSSPNHLLVATVTGVSPYISFIRNFIHHNRRGHHFYVMEGASYLDEFAYDRELRQLSSQHPDLITFIPTISRPYEEHNRGWTGETGRVNLIMERYTEQFGLEPQDTFVYLCGHPGMIEDTKKRMNAKGFQLKEERFWKE